MHLAVEAIALTRNLRGMGRYARSLLAEMPLQRPELRYTILARNAADIAPLREQLSGVPDIAERATFLPAHAMSTVRCDAAWYPCNFVTHRPASGAIVPTVHDLFPMLQLDGRWWKVMKRTRARMRYRSTLTVADHVITGARAASRELQSVFGIPDGRISVVPHAADDFRSADPALVDDLLATLRVEGPFLLAVGSQEPRKNLGVLYAAMRQLDTQGRALPLVLCGPRGVHGYKVGDAVPHWLRTAGFVTDQQLAALYARATALVFPSRYEGFGLPVLEAMTVGGVVICANVSTMPEVGGDAVLFFPPDDAPALAAQVLRLLDESALRAQLVSAGTRQSANYSWARSARGTLDAIDRGIAAARRRT
ncbi:MAG TPA: glycosyltransferase family 1 protein [Gemmatimonadaceae bacterium]|nr:glycosyltransferase family 1 protein [Gemmatimonadaceae bacterium]